MEFKDILKELRIERRLTHEQLAQGIDQSKAIIGFWESGRNQPKVESIIRLATFFGVSADYLLGLEYSDGVRPPSAPEQIAKSNTAISTISSKTPWPNASKSQKQGDELLDVFYKLDNSSKIKLLGYIRGLYDNQNQNT